MYIPIARRRGFLIVLMGKGALLCGSMAAAQCAEKKTHDFHEKESQEQYDDDKF